MDVVNNAVEVCSFNTALLLLLLTVHRKLSEAAVALAADESSAEDVEDFLTSGCTASGLDAATTAALQHFYLFSTLVALDDDLGFWVKPRSTTWFSRFLVHEYDDNRWIQMFRISKRCVFSLAELLVPAVKKKDTRYRLAITVLVRVACTLFKLSHGASVLICSKFFVVGHSTVSIMLW